MTDDPKPDGEKLAKDTKFKPGHVANPAGRPKGSRNKLGEEFIRAMHDDFVEHGKQVIETVRTEKPDQYLKVIASILPKQAEITVNEYDRMDDGQLRSALTAAIKDLATLGIDIGAGSSAGIGEEGQAEQPGAVQAVH